MKTARLPGHITCHSRLDYFQPEPSMGRFRLTKPLAPLALPRLLLPDPFLKLVSCLQEPLQTSSQTADCLPPVRVCRYPECRRDDLLSVFGNELLIAAQPAQRLSDPSSMANPFLRNRIQPITKICPLSLRICQQVRSTPREELLSALPSTPDERNGGRHSALAFQDDEISNRSLLLLRVMSNRSHA